MPLSPRHPAAPVSDTWLSDRLPLTDRITGHYRRVWALHAAGLSDGEVATALRCRPSDVQIAVRSIYRALAIDPEGGMRARAQAARLYRVVCSGGDSPAKQPH